jgi:hypothetical protein
MARTIGKAAVPRKRAWRFDGERDAWRLDALWKAATPEFRAAFIKTWWPEIRAIAERAGLVP